MRTSALAALAYLALASGGAALGAEDDDWALSAGSGNFALEKAGDAVAIRRTACCGGAGMLRKSAALGNAWNGMRLRLALRLKDDGAAMTDVWLQFRTKDGGVIRAERQQNIYGTRYWQRHEFLLDVPEDAVAVEYGISTTGRGASWVDSVSLGAVSRTVPRDPRSGGNGRERNWGNDTPIVGYANDYNPPVQVPSPIGTGVLPAPSR